MPTSKKHKHPKKRNNRNSAEIIRTPSNDVLATIHVDVDPAGLIKMAHNEGISYFNRGRRDKANGAEVMTLNRFIKRFDLLGRGFPADVNRNIAEAQYSIYLDGYTGAEYIERVTFERGYSL